MLLELTMNKIHLECMYPIGILALLCARRQKKYLQDPMHIGNKEVPTSSCLNLMMEMTGPKISSLKMSMVEFTSVRMVGR